MSLPDLEEKSRFLYDNLRLKTYPVGAKFLKKKDELPKEARRPSQFLGKRITICQAMTLARNYGWQMGITEKDIICPLAALAFGFTDLPDARQAMAEAFLVSNYKSGLARSRSEADEMCFLDSREYEALLISPLQKSQVAPDTIAVYGNPAQVSRMVQAATFDTEEKIHGLFGGKVECPEYLIRPMKEGRPRVVVPGPGDRVFSMTADDEMIFAFPYAFLEAFITGLRESGKKVGARYPITFYQNFQPEFPKHYQELAKRLGIQES